METTWPWKLQRFVLKKCGHSSKHRLILTVCFMALGSSVAGLSWHDEWTLHISHIRMWSRGRYENLLCSVLHLSLGKHQYLNLCVLKNAFYSVIFRNNSLILRLCLCWRVTEVCIWVIELIATWQWNVSHLFLFLKIFYFKTNTYFCPWFEYNLQTVNSVSGLSFHKENEQPESTSSSNISTASLLSDEDSPVFHRTKTVTFVDIETVASSSVGYYCGF